MEGGEGVRGTGGVIQLKDGGGGVPPLLAEERGTGTTHLSPAARLKAASQDDATRDDISAALNGRAEGMSAEHDSSVEAPVAASSPVGETAA